MQDRDMKFPLKQVSNSTKRKRTIWVEKEGGLKEDGPSREDTGKREKWIRKVNGEKVGGQKLDGPKVGGHKVDVPSWKSTKQR